MLVPLTAVAFTPLSFAVSTPSIANVSSSTPMAMELPKEKTVKEIFMDASIKYNQPFEDIWDTVGGETQWTYDCKMQSNVIYNFSDSKRGIVAGTRERSFGCAMIHLPDHPDITYASATDAYFAADFIAKNWGKHKCWWYYYANKHKNECIS